MKRRCMRDASTSRKNASADMHLSSSIRAPLCDRQLKDAFPHGRVPSFGIIPASFDLRFG